MIHVSCLLFSMTTFQVLVPRLLTTFTTPLMAHRISIISWRTNIDFIWKQLNLPKFLLYCLDYANQKRKALTRSPLDFFVSALTLSPLVCCIFNGSITTSINPEEWKCSKVIPLFKQGERSGLNNYRLISIIPVVGKVFERIVYDQYYIYLTERNLISSKQSGFQ